MHNTCYLIIPTQKNVKYCGGCYNIHSSQSQYTKVAAFGRQHKRGGAAFGRATSFVMFFVFALNRGNIVAITTILVSHVGAIGGVRKAPQPWKQNEWPWGGKEMNSPSWTCLIDQSFYDAPAATMQLYPHSIDSVQCRIRTLLIRLAWQLVVVG